MAGIGRRQVRGGERPAVKKLINNGNKNTIAVKALPAHIPTPKVPTKKRLYVIDTNVFMHDPRCLFRFQEHDIYVPKMVLEELDNHKKGHDEINRNVREVARTLERLVSQNGVVIKDGVPLLGPSGGIASGSLFLQMEELANHSGEDKPDNKILAVVSFLVEQKKNICEVVLVSRDTMMRIKGRASGMIVEDYHSDVVIEDTDLLYSGIYTCPPDFWTKYALSSWTEGHTNYYRISHPLVKSLWPNQFVYSVVDGKVSAGRLTEKEGKGAAIFQVPIDHTKEKHSVSGIIARNPEQSFALSLLLNPEIDFVTLVGQAGSGKTLLALAAGIAQVVDGDRYSEIIITRITVPVGEDIGYLPGNEDEKMNPWMGALEDNLEVLSEVSSTSSQKKFQKGSLNDFQKLKEVSRSDRKELLRSRIKVKSMSFMRGRTFLRKFVIIDEVQNLTAKQAKTLVTRAGPGTKIVCLGNLSQIDTPYLTEGSSGLTHLVDRFRNWEHSGSITLVKGERSRLASYANDAL
jgi:PhoH-like ATPase